MSVQVLLLCGDSATGFELPDHRSGLRRRWTDRRPPEHPRRIFTDTLAARADGTCPEPRNATRWLGRRVTLLIDSPEEEIHLVPRSGARGFEHHPSDAPAQMAVHSRAGFRWFRFGAGGKADHRPCLPDASRAWIDTLVEQGMRVENVYLFSGLAAALVPDRGVWLVMLGGGAQVRHVLVEQRQALFVRHLRCRDDRARVAMLEETLDHLAESPLARSAWSVLCVGVGESVLDRLADIENVGRLHSLPVADARELPVDAAAWHLVRQAAGTGRHGQWRSSPWHGSVLQLQGLRRLRQTTLAVAAMALSSLVLAGVQVAVHQDRLDTLAAGLLESSALVQQAQVELEALHAQPDRLAEVVADAARHRERFERDAAQVAHGTRWVLQGHPGLVIQTLSWSVQPAENLAMANSASGLAAGSFPVPGMPAGRSWQDDTLSSASAVVLEMAGVVTEGSDLRDKQRRFEGFRRDLAERWPRARWHVEQAPVDAVQAPLDSGPDETRAPASDAPFVLRGYLVTQDDLDV